MNNTTLYIVNFTEMGKAGISKTMDKLSYASVIRANCDSWSRSSLQYGIVLVVCALILKYCIEKGYVDKYPWVKDYVFFACYTAILMIGVILIAMVFIP